MCLQGTPSARVIAAHVRDPLCSQYRTLYELITEHGRYFSAAEPELRDVSGDLITLAAEVAPVSTVRVAARAGQMRAIR